VRNSESDKLFLHAVPQNIQMWVIDETVVKQITDALSVVLYHKVDGRGFLSLYLLHEGQNIGGPLAT
jgi:hypothetical protein